MSFKWASSTGSKDLVSRSLSTSSVLEARTTGIYILNQRFPKGVVDLTEATSHQKMNDQIVTQI